MPFYTRSKYIGCFLVTLQLIVCVREGGGGREGSYVEDLKHKFAEFSQNEPPPSFVQQEETQ